MTIEQLADEATDGENFSLDGEVMLETTDGKGHVEYVDMDGKRVSLVPVTAARYDNDKKLLILSVETTIQSEDTITITKV